MRETRVRVALSGLQEYRGVIMDTEEPIVMYNQYFVLHEWSNESVCVCVCRVPVEEHCLSACFLILSIQTSPSSDSHGLLGKSPPIASTECTERYGIDTHTHTVSFAQEIFLFFD